ncbi:class C sortase [Streptococcus suis]|uniref:Class C sortase n=1 Tax=Streptococcus suis TaxID=1307 RepID=A0A6L8MYQ4_STRSU|nr:class C sortase [Streptococcus suis]
MAGKKMFSVWLTIGFLSGLLLLLYPSFSDYWNSFHQSQAIMSYAENVSRMTEEDYKSLFKQAHEYNQTIAKHVVSLKLNEGDRKRYQSQLNINGDGIMGYISIPKIDVKLSIHHGTDDAVLQTAVGHVEGTSLPIGGEGTHSVLSAHRGLPSAKLFTELDQLKEGDLFTLHILNETLTYEVDQIRVVFPTNLTDLAMVNDEDYCTLVTCTPYGINTHRLLVRGHRISNVDGDVKLVADALQIKPLFVAPILAIPVLLGLILFIYVSTSSFIQKRKVDFAEYDGLNYRMDALHTQVVSALEEDVKKEKTLRSENDIVD